MVIEFSPVNHQAVIGLFEESRGIDKYIFKHTQNREKRELTGRIEAQSFMVLDLVNGSDCGHHHQCARSLAASFAARKRNPFLHDLMLLGLTLSKFNANLISFTFMTREATNFLLETLAFAKDSKW
jgi:hypothetical protein